jgi:hypothetical protein
MCTAMAWLRVGMAARKDLVFQRAHGCFEESVVEGLPPRTLAPRQAREP